MSWLLEAIAAFGGLVRSLLRLSAAERRIQWRLTLRAFVRLLRTSVVPLALGGIATAALVSSVLYQQLERYGASSYLPTELSLVLVRELVPLVASFVLLTRAAVSYAAELATERVEGEMDALDAMGLSSIALRLAPRALALTLGGAIAMFAVALLGVQTDYVLSAMRGSGATADFATTLRGAFSPLEGLLTVALGAVVGALLALASIVSSSEARTPGDIPWATRRCATGGLILIIIAHGLDASLRYGFR